MNRCTPSNVIQTFLKKLEVEKYSIYLMDYGAPVGMMVAERDPGRVQTLIVQNGNAYEEGLLHYTGFLVGGMLLIGAFFVRSHAAATWLASQQAGQCQDGSISSGQVA